MDYNNGYHYRQQQLSRNPGMTMATISMIFGIGSIFTILTIYLSLILGSLSILFAILSKGYGQKLLAGAKIGIGTAIGSMALVITIMVSVMGLILGSSRETMLDLGRQMDQQIEDQMGISPEDLLGESYEDIMKQYADLMGK